MSFQLTDSVLQAYKAAIHSTHSDWAEIYSLEEEFSIGFAFGARESFQSRSLFKARSIAHFIVTEKGEIDQEKAKTILSYISAGVPPYPFGENDSLFWEQVEMALREILNHREVGIVFKRISPPVCHPHAAHLVAETVGCAWKEVISKRHLVLALLISSFVPLRQRIGSCFASAPAIIVQKEQLIRLLKDLESLLMTGQMKRVYEGREVRIPLAPWLGKGDLREKLDEQSTIYPPFLAVLKALDLNITDVEGSVARAIIQRESYEGLVKALTIKDKDRLELAFSAFRGVLDPALLRAWEITLASFSEAKGDRSNWHLFQGLGLKHTEKGGIGEGLYAEIDRLIEEKNHECDLLEREYLVILEGMEYVKGKVEHAQSEHELLRIKADYQARAHEGRVVLEKKEKLEEAIQKYRHLLHFLYERYIELFAENFQEIFDPDLYEAGVRFFDDAPAGFRLIYKHGRRDPTAWTIIYDESGFVRALTDFFIQIESQISYDLEDKGFSVDYVRLSAAAIAVIQGKNFTQLASLRIQTLCESTDYKHISPWAYISGGTMETLLNHYFELRVPYLKESVPGTNPMDLCVKLIDRFKDLPGAVFNPTHRGAVFAESKTHAFSILPDLADLNRLIRDREYTYTKVRDQFLNPARRFYRLISFDHRHVNYLKQRLQGQIGVHEKSLRGIDESVRNPREFYSAVMSVISNSRGCGISEEELSSFLFAHLPLFTPEEASNKIASLFPELSISLPPIVTGRELFFLILYGHLEKIGRLDISLEFVQNLENKARSVGILLPKPLVFADTNWLQCRFSFVVHPGTQEFELWRTNINGLIGTPMRIWEDLWNTEPPAQWKIYPKRDGRESPDHLTRLS